MRILKGQEIIAISGGNDTDTIFECVLFGTTTGFFAGTVASLQFISKYPLLAVMPGVMERTLKVGALGGACMGGVLGLCTGILLDDV